jgi:hypothetical protein
LDRLREIYRDFKNSNNKIYFLLTHKKLFLWSLAGLAFVLGVFGYVESEKINGFDVINRAFGLFAFAWIDDTNGFLVVARFLAVLALFLGAVALFLSDMVNLWIVRTVLKKPYTLVIGLGEQNSNFLKSQNDKTSSTIIVEKDHNNSHIDSFKELGYGIILKDAQSAIDEMELTHLQNAIISTGDDRQNINIALHLMQKLPKESFAKLFVRIENRDLGVRFKQIVIKKHGRVDVIVYSLYEQMTKRLFNQHTILGLQQEIIRSEEPFCIVIVGDTPLAQEVIFQLCILSNLPNQNRLTIYLVSREANKFYEKVCKCYSQIEAIPHIDFVPLERDSQSLTFYKDEIWHQKNLTTVIIATGSDRENLDIAINLQDTTYIRAIARKAFRTNVLFAHYVDLGIAQKIDKDQGAFANFYSFANIAKASQAKNLIDKERELTAKAVHYFYKKIVYDPSLLIDEDAKRELDKSWSDIRMYSDKLSSRMQSIHIDTKLLALGLKKKKSSKSPKKLLQINRAILNKKLARKEEDDRKLQLLSQKLAKLHNGEIFDFTKTDDFKPDYFPEKFDTLFAKLVRSEHNRWMTYHYLDGWRYSKVKNKSAKEHDCLIPLEEFKDDKLKALVLFDIYSVVYLPNIMASIGVELVEA